jgi:hypothetical protein
VGTVARIQKVHHHGCIEQQTPSHSSSQCVSHTPTALPPWERHRREQSPSAYCSVPSIAPHSFAPCLPPPPHTLHPLNIARPLYPPPQVASEARAVAKHCGVPISITTLLGDTPVAQRAAAAAAGALVVTTPARISASLRESWVQPQTLAKSLQMVILDEADLLLSYGYSEDLQALAVHIPRSAQCLLMSATSSSEVDQLQQLILHNPVTLNLLVTPAAAAAAAGGSNGDPAAAAAAGGGALGAGGAGTASEIVHYGFQCSAADRRLVVLALLKLGLLRKKVREGETWRAQDSEVLCCVRIRVPPPTSPSPPSHSIDTHKPCPPSPVAPLPLPPSPCPLPCPPPPAPSPAPPPPPPSTGPDLHQQD